MFIKSNEISLVVPDAPPINGTEPILATQNRYRRTKTPESPEDNFRLKAETEEFLGECRAWKQKIKSGDAVETDYIIWLHKRKGEVSNGKHPSETE